MENHHPNLIIISISMMYWFKTSVDCWKFDSQFAADNNNNNGGAGTEGGGGGNNNNDLVSNNFINLYRNHDILYACPINSMCQCSGMPNDTSTLIEINCNEVAFYKYPEFLQSSIRYIELSKAHLQSIDDETFPGLRLETLKIIDNQIQDISEKAFSTMTHSLLTLDISGNQLQSLPLEAIRNLHSLSRLAAQRNHLTTIEANWGSLTESLRSLHLGGNKISEISAAQNQDDDIRANMNSSHVPLTAAVQGNGKLSSSSVLQTASLVQYKRPFAKLRKLVWLDLSSNRIYHIQPQYLPRSIITIDLTKNLLLLFPQQLFEHLIDLRIISLRDNLIRTVQCKELRIMKMHLEKLDLGQNLIDEIQTDWFQNDYNNVHLKALNLEKNFIKILPPSAFRNIGIVHLVLSFNEINRIHIDAFDGITNTLEYLDLERNQLQGVPGAIKKLAKLKYLYLTSNNIAHLSNLPEKSENLRVLSLSGNNFTSIPLEALKNFTELSYLNMGYNTVAEIPDGVFQGWGSQLQTILLRNNKITSLHYGSFSGLNSIKEISLSFNDIVYTNPYVFENISKTLKILELSFSMYRDEFPMESLSPLTELMWLGLDNNNLKIINNESISTMKELTYINLSFNQIQFISQNLFLPDVHKHLVDIDLSYNIINNITTKTFSNLYELQNINLQSNKIKFLNKYSFYNLEYLRNLDISYNKIMNITDNCFSYLPSLINLNLSYNSITTLTMKIFHFVSTNSTLKLYLNNNNLIKFNDDLTSYLYIIKLDLSYNYLTINSFNFNNLGNTLKILNLKSNQLNNLGNHAFGDLIYLEILNLSNNNITTIRRRSFQGLNNLQVLDLSLNQLEQLQVEQFSNLKKLRELKLNSNKLRALPREVFINTRLEYLDLSNNYLSVWPVPAFSDIGFTLRIIKFSSNYLEYLDSTMFINSQFLYDLNLSRNKITVLPDNTFMFLNNLTNLDLSLNPLVTSNLREVFLHTLRIRKLLLNGMGLYVLPNFNLQYLTELDLSNNYIQEIYSFHDMRMLRILNISNNKIINASCIIEQLPNSIKILDLSYNPIRRFLIYDMIALKHLDQLNLIDIKITNPIIFSKLKTLRILKLTASQQLGEIVSRLNGLQELHVHVIDSVIKRELFAKLINNTKLNLVEIYGQNVHTIMSSAFEGLARNYKLKIRLRNTKISDLPPGIFYTLRSVPDLSIDISDNRISTLAADSFYPNITYWDTVGTRSIIGGLDTANNPLECECGLVWFGHWLRRWLRESSQIKAISNEEMKKMVQRARRNTCQDPTTGRKLPILEIFPEDLLCHASALSSCSEKPNLISYILLFLPIMTALFRIFVTL